MDKKEKKLEEICNIRKHGGHDIRALERKRKVRHQEEKNIENGNWNVKPTLENSNVEQK